MQTTLEITLLCYLRPHLNTNWLQQEQLDLHTQKSSEFFTRTRSPAASRFYEKACHCLLRAVLVGCLGSRLVSSVNFIWLSQ